MMPEILKKIADDQPYPLLFVTISGAHLYGFPSPDSDYDLRGVHLLPAAAVLGLRSAEETIEVMEEVSGIELDLVTHDAEKFFRMLLKRNGYVLEQLYSPLVVRTSPAHERLKAIAQGCITRQHGKHYLGFSRNQWVLFQKKTPSRVKPLLYTFRVLLTGIHLMHTGEVEANLNHLNQIYKQPYLQDLMDLKVNGHEKAVLADPDLPFYEAEVNRLTAQLERAMAESTLPDAPTSFEALDDLLVSLRINNAG
jgi:hypothetical protein